MKQKFHARRIETLSLKKHTFGRFFWIVILLRKFECAEFQTSCFQYAVCRYLAFVLSIIQKMFFPKFWNNTSFSKSLRSSMYLQVSNYMSWTHISNIAKNTFLTILILRMYIVDPYYYSNGIFTKMLNDVRASCFSFSICSINNPISIDSGSESSSDRETPRK